MFKMTYSNSNIKLNQGLAGGAVMHIALPFVNSMTQNNRLCYFLLFDVILFPFLCRIYLPITTVGVKCCTVVLKSLPVLHFDVAYIFLSFEITELF